MKGSPLVLMVLSLAACRGRDVGESTRFIRASLVPGTSTTVVVAEGDLEPASIGSYSVRIYKTANPDFPYDDFLAGIVKPRDGAVADLRFSDLDDDGFSDIIVVIHSAGSGGYLSADAFQLQDAKLTLLASVSGLPANTDAVQALEADIEKPDH